MRPNVTALIEAGAQTLKNKDHRDTELYATGTASLRSSHEQKLGKAWRGGVAFH